MRVVIHGGDPEEAARASEAISRLLPGSIVDIVRARTGLKQSEALQESEERFRELLEHANDIIFTLDFAGRIISINKGGERTLGYSRNELVGTSIWPIVPPHARGPAQKRLAEKSSGGGSTSYESEVTTKDGRAILLEMSSHTLMRGGRPSEVLVVARDVTQRRRAEEALRESEERFRELFEQANDAVCLTTMEGDFIAVNPAAERIFGRSHHELSTMNLRQVIAPDHLDRAKQMRDSKVAGAGRTLYELDIVRPDGTHVPLEVNSTVVRRDDRSVAIQAVARDITDRWRADQALRESEERYRLLFEGAHDMVYTLDLEGYYTSVNGAAVRLLDIPREEIIGSHVSRFATPESLLVSTHMRDRKLGGVQQTLYELDIVTPSGRRVTLELNTSLIYRDGHPVGVQGIARDVTERKRFEERLQRLTVELEDRIAERTAVLHAREGELRDAKLFLEHLIQSSPGVIVRGSFDASQTLYVSPNVEQMLGYTPAEIVATPNFWAAHFHPDERQSVWVQYRNAVAKRSTQIKLEHRFLLKDGTYRWLLSVVRPEYEDINAPQSSLAYILDISDRVAAEEAAHRANQAKSEFLSRMSHELRTPLNAILGFAQLMELEAGDNAHREGVQQILQAGRHLLDLINEVLDISKIEAGQLALTLEPVDVSHVAGETLTLVLPLAAARNLTISSEGASNAREARVLADGQRLKQVLLNLLGNAVKYNSEGGRIGLSWEVTATNHVRINVSDSGPGISTEKLNRLFNPFDRLDMEGSAIEGTGLGLALSKRLVELMGGTIGVVSAPGAGSTFWVELSRAEGLLAAVPQVAAAAESRPHLGNGVDGCIVYVEDNL